MATTLVTLTAMAAVAGMPGDNAEFEAPIEITAGGTNFAGTLYPSPALFDINGDGEKELIIGDLIGYLQVASRESGDMAAGWGKATQLKMADGKDLKFDNW